MLGIKTLVKKLLRRLFEATARPEREKLQFLLYENSSIRKILRHLVAENPHYLAWIAQTSSSFDFQWDQLPKSASLLGNPDFDKKVCDLVCAFTGLPAAWFPGKEVLGAGCGNGRFSWAFARLGANVTAFDLSLHGTANLQRLAEEAGLPIQVFQHNVLEAIDLKTRFDLVWSFGVLHHTGNTFRGFQNIHPLVGANGHMFLMLYGEPRAEVVGDFEGINIYERLRRKTQNLDFAEKIKVLENDPVVNDVHGWFDAVSPFINDLYTFEEIENWLHQAGFVNVRRTQHSVNHFVVAKKTAPAELPYPVINESRQVA